VSTAMIRIAKQNSPICEESPHRMERRCGLAWDSSV
jgi:hypothetical protein